jgi:hypothetical protein
MISINLVDDTTKVKHIEFCVLPVTTERDFKCSPDDSLPLCSVVRLSRKLQAGRTFGHIGKYLWYRLSVAPAGSHSGKCQPSPQYRMPPLPTPL